MEQNPVPEPSSDEIAAEAFQSAVRIIGSKAEIARRLKISRSAVAQWDRVPPLRARAVSQMSGVPFEKLAPELAEAKPEGSAP